MAFSLVKDCYILRISYVYVTYILRIWYVIDSGNDKVLPHTTLPHKVKTMNMGGRTYPVRYYPIAIWLRDRKGRAILCIALFPQSGDSSGAILGVRSVALLHVIDSGKIRKDWVKIVHIELRILNFEGKSCVYLKKIVPL